MADSQRPHDPDRTQVIPVGTGSGRSAPRPAPRVGSGRAPDAPPGAGVLPPGAGRVAGGYGDAGDNRYGGRPADRSRGGAPGPQPGRPQGPGSRQPSPPQSARPLPASGGSRRRRRLLRTVFVLLLLAVLVYPFAVAATAWRSLTRTAVLSGGIADTPGRTYLVVGSDSRAGLTKAQQRQLHTGGDTFGKRTDTIMLMHVPSSGGPTVLMSVPRDSYVPIPGHGSNKVNAAYAFGGARLLAQSLEGATGVQIDDYVEIGFGGFATMVDAVGGVQICPKRAMNDKNAGINLKKGCQQADGKVALGYARARYSDPRGDLGRVERQREVLAAIVGKASAPTTLVNPFRTFPLARAGGSSLTVDDQMGQIALARFLLGMRSSAGSGGVSLTVPVTGTARRAGAGSVVLWDEAKAGTVFDALKRSDTTPITAIAAEQKAAA